MSRETPKDPGEAFRDMVTQWERGFDALANRLMGTEGYSRSMNQFQDAQLGAQKAFRDFMTQNLTMANMPTRDDVVRVAEAVQQLDRRLERIEELLAAQHPEAVSPPPRRHGPPRTKRPPSAAGDGTGSTP